jgi:GNAT superfamily N-acetyltransferase
MSVEIIPVKGYHDFKVFLQLPLLLYPENERSKILPPRVLQDKFNPNLNPFLRHIAWQPFLAVQGENPVGRIVASIDEHFPREKTGFFGFWETIDDRKVAGALFRAAEEWLKQRGKEEIIGPVDLTPSDNLGLLIEGYALPNYFYLTFNQPCYQKLIEQSGYSKFLDLFSYSWQSNQPVSQRLLRISARLKRAKNLTIRPIRYRKADDDAKAFLSIYNSAMVQNWGHVPLTLDEVKYIITMHRRQVKPEYFLFAEANGVPAGMCMAIPHPPTHCLRLALLAVHPEFNHLGISAILIMEIMQTALNAGLTCAELSYVEEHNKAVNKLIQEDIGSKAAKRYRLYTKKL